MWNWDLHSFGLNRLSVLETFVAKEKRLKSMTNCLNVTNWAKVSFIFKHRVFDYMFVARNIKRFTFIKTSALWESVDWTKDGIELNRRDCCFQIPRITIYIFLSNKVYKAITPTQGVDAFKTALSIIWTIKRFTWCKNQVFNTSFLGVLYHIVLKSPFLKQATRWSPNTFFKTNNSLCVEREL